MTDEEVLAAVKLDLRIDYDDLDKDIAANIAAAVTDLGIAGVANTDELTMRAVKLFCRRQYDFDGRADAYDKAYEALKKVLSVAQDGGGNDA